MGKLLVILFAIHIVNIEVVGRTAGAEHILLTLGTRSAENTTPCDQTTFYKVEAVEPCQDLKIDVTQIGGEPNLYVSRGMNMYPSLRNLAWSSYNWGHDSITVSSNDPDYKVGTFYIGVHAYCGNDVHTGHTAATYTVIATHESHFGSGSTDLYQNRTISAKLVSNTYIPFRFCAPKQCQNVNITIKHCMAIDEAGCNGKYGFPELLVSKTVPTPKVTDMAWLLGEASRRTIQLSPSDPDFDPGHYYISVYGWCTAPEHCPDRNTCGPCDLTEDLDVEVSVSAEDIPQDECQELLSGRPSQNVCTSGSTLFFPASIFYIFTLAAIYY